MTTWGEEEGEGTPEVESECLGKEKRNGWRKILGEPG